MDLNSQHLQLYDSQKLDNGQIWLLFLLLGWSYGSMDKMGLQILFYLTGGLCGIWWVYRLITLGGDIKNYNRTIATRVGIPQEQFHKLGL